MMNSLEQEKVGNVIHLVLVVLVIGNRSQTSEIIQILTIKF